MKNRDQQNDVQINLGKATSPIARADKLFEGKTQMQLAAVHVEMAKDYAETKVKITFSPDGDFKVRTKESVIIGSDKGDITIRRYLAYGHVKVITGNADLAKLADQPAMLDLLAQAFDGLTDHKGAPATRVHLSGKEEVTLARIDQRWINLTPKGKAQIHAIDLDRKTGAFYGFRTDNGGHRIEIVKLDADKLKDADAKRWDKVTNLPAGSRTFFYDASRLVEDDRGHKRLQVAFTNNMTRTAEFKKNGETLWTDAEADDKVLLSRLWFGKDPGVVAQIESGNDTKLVFYPETDMPKAYKTYAEAKQAS